MIPTQADREAFLSIHPDPESIQADVSAGAYDQAYVMKRLVLFRLAAEAAAFEKAAAYIEGKGGVIPGATVFISLITGSNQPCMSGDGRDHLHSHRRRQFDDATSTLATAIRKLAGEKHDAQS